MRLDPCHHRGTPGARRGALLLLALLAGCVRREPPQWDSGDSGFASAPLPPSLATLPPAAGAQVPATTDQPHAEDASAEAGSDTAEIDSGALPQTLYEPAASGPRFEAGVAALRAPSSTTIPSAPCRSSFPSPRTSR